MTDAPADEVVLVRHAATAWSGVRYCGTSDPSLSQGGLDAATRLAATLRGFTSGARVITSPLRRAIQTAELIAQGLGGPLVVDDRWRETDFGDAEGLTFDEVQQRWPVLAASLLAGDAAIDWPGGERHRDLVARVESVWADLTAADDPRGSIVVAHGGPITEVLALASRGSGLTVPLLAPGEFVRLTRSAANIWQPAVAVAATLRP
jgi:probable phosphoglycerate mutase